MKIEKTIQPSGTPGLGEGREVVIAFIPEDGSSDAERLTALEEALTAIPELLAAEVNSVTGKAGGRITKFELFVRT